MYLISWSTCVVDTKRIVQVLIGEWVHWINPFVELFTVMWYPMSDRGSIAPVVWLVLWLETPRISCAWSPFFDTVSQIWIIWVSYAWLLGLVVECTKVIECQDRIILSRYHWESIFYEVVLREILGQGRSDSERKSSPRDSDNEHDLLGFHIGLTPWPYLI